MGTPAESAPGWEAIERSLQAIYGDQEPLHWAPDVPPMLGGAYPFHGLSLYRSERHSPHWHAVTFGLSELFGKDSDDPDVSGFGFELTVRLPRAAAEDDVRRASQLLAPLGQYVRKTGNRFGHGHRIPMDFQTQMPGTELGGIALCLDPELGRIATPHGRLEFLQLVGITRDELDTLRQARGSSDCLFRVLERVHPLLVMDFDRGSVLDDPESRREVEGCLAESK
ncbi:MAG: suppressor of fused domain protein [Acidobacteriota bacterium]